MDGQTEIGVVPLADGIIIEREVTPERTAAGLYIPEQARRALKAGRVVAVGPGRLLPNGTRVPPPVEIGEHVLYQGEWQGEDLSGWTSPVGKAYRVLDSDQVAAAFVEGADVEVERYE